MLSAEQFISIVAERGLLPARVIDAFRQHLREMEQYDRHASAKDVAQWLVKHGHFPPNVVEEILQRAEDRAPDPSGERQLRSNAANHDAQPQITTGDSRSAPMPRDIQGAWRDTATLPRSPLRTEQSTCAGTGPTGRREADRSDPAPCGTREDAPPANHTNVPQVDFADNLPICRSHHKDRDSLFVPAIVGFVAASCVILLTYPTTVPRNNVAAFSKASKTTDSPDRVSAGRDRATKSGKNSAMLDWENYSPSITKQRVESSNTKPATDTPVIQPDESSDEKPPTEKPVVRPDASSDEKPLAGKPAVQSDERLQEMAAQALLPDEFDSVARDALKEASRAMAQGNRELVRKTLRLALVSARKSENTRRVDTVVLCLLDVRKGAKSLQTRLTEIAWPARNVGESADARFPVPTEAERTKTRRSMVEVYGAKIAAAKDLAQKQTLAMEFLRTAKETQNDCVARFVLLDLAREEAVNGMDCPTALLAVDEMALSFQIRSIEIKAKMLKTLALSGTDTEHHKQLSESACELVESALAKDNFAVADELAKLAVREAEKTWYNQLIEASIVRQREVERILAACQSLNESVTKLETTPDDPKCNLHVGRYQCFVKGDWDRGLSSLALGDDKQLQELAEQDLRGIASPDEEVALGDRWWNLAVRGENGPGEATKARARYWYKKANAGLVGFVKDRVQQRLDCLTPKSLVETAELPDPLLPGDWQIVTGSFKGRWTFSPNGTVVASGSGKRKPTSAVWKMDSGSVLVRWTPDTWSTLHCPLKLKDAVGESWQGKKRESLTANKVQK